MEAKPSHVSALNSIVGRPAGHRCPAMRRRLVWFAGPKERGSNHGPPEPAPIRDFIGRNRSAAPNINLPGAHASVRVQRKTFPLAESKGGQYR